jgi:hypothetical protein
MAHDVAEFASDVEGLPTGFYGEPAFSDLFSHHPTSRFSNEPQPVDALRVSFAKTRSISFTLLSFVTKHFPAAEAGRHMGVAVRTLFSSHISNHRKRARHVSDFVRSASFDPMVSRDPGS